MTRPSLNGYADTRERFEAMCTDLFGILESGQIHVAVNRRYPLAQAGETQAAVAARRTTGSTVLIP